MVEVFFDGWLIIGCFNDVFEKKFGEFIGVFYVLMIIFGFLVNLLVLIVLIFLKLGECVFKSGDEVIIVVVGFLIIVNLVI